MPVKVQQAIHWPAFIQYAGQAELAFVADQPAWEAEVRLHSHIYQPADRLVDSLGQLYAFGRDGDALVLEATSQKLVLDELLQLVRAHAAQAGLCCIAKLSASSIAEAVRLVGTMRED
jgi:hypothetical protein